MLRSVAADRYARIRVKLRLSSEPTVFCFNALQVAARRLSAPRAMVTICSNNGASMGRDHE
jgi:hypothetical protein